MTHSSSADLATRAARVLAGGATHAARSYPHPIHVVAAQGARKWLVDGRELVDYTMGHGALLLGHAHPAVVEAVRAQVARGTHFGAASELEVRWAELVAGMVPSVERIRFTASGTEAVMLALRLTRAATGRAGIVKLDDHFNGWYDAVSVNLDERDQGMPAAGVSASAVAGTRVVRAGDVDGLGRALEDRQCAALIFEVSGAHYGRSPLDPAYIAEARRLCDATETALIFDEVVTGFRIEPGGMQARLGVRPDLTIFGKVMAGGLPGGAVGGRATYMDLLTVPTTAGDRAAYVYHPGTFNANPLTAAAGIATLELVHDGTAQERASAFADRLTATWTDVLQEAGVPGRVWRLASIVHCALDDATAQASLGGALRDQGIDVLHTSAFCSTVHGDEELERSDAAFRSALREVMAVRS